ncbi:DNA repair protein RecO [Patescibacteria group bacterium]|nr:DNA repair protein RecO [Patescibacteria group bacterium]MBU2035869.1 DNA repair protein RecO [Patescibacteria group bacterium]
MRQRNYSTEAIILATKDYSEADRILVVYTKDFGKLSLIAKGVRKTTSKKRGHLEIFNYLKFSAVKSKGLDIMIEADLINSFPKIRKNLKKISVGYYFCEVIGKITKEEEKHLSFLEFIIDYFLRLEKEDNLTKVRKDFVKDILINLGYWPKGKVLVNPDKVLEAVIERNINSTRVGKRILE